MNISSEMYCESQFPRMHVMIPTVQNQHGIFVMRPGQQNPPDAGNPSYIPLNNQQQNCINLHGNANTNVKILNKIAANDDDPIDLSSTSTITSSTVNDPQERKNAKKSSKPRKRKYSCEVSETVVIDDNKRNIESWVGHVKPVPGIPRQAGSKREEVLKAARSLFSKRTRTLYHWLCPTTSKTKLKTTVAAAWDTLSTAEKDFYISQVLGRFGVPACSLMVNPQLGGMNTNEKPSSSIMMPGPSNMEETRRAVSNLLLNENDVAWSPYSRQIAEIPRKKRKTLKPEVPNNEVHQEEEQTLILKEIRDASLEEDFADDPELNTEFEQFRNLIDIELARFDFNDILDGI